MLRAISRGGVCVLACVVLLAAGCNDGEDKTDTAADVGTPDGDADTDSDSDSDADSDGDSDSDSDTDTDTDTDSDADSDTDTDSDTDSDADTDTGEDTGGVQVDEVCDGADNDGDGEIDEDFPDTDVDGLADCLDTSCEVDLPGADTVTTLLECQGYDPAVVADPWNVTLEWEFGQGLMSVVSPVTGQLTDDNGDGLVDELDTPDVALTSYLTNQVYIVSGDGSGEICHQDGWRGDAGVIIADVDNDGQNEVVGPLPDGRVRSMDGACVTEWTSPNANSLLWPVTTAADLDADGDVEVIADIAVLDGATGAPIATLAPLNPSPWRTPLTGDLDQDGDVEIVLGNTVFDSTGTALWGATGSGTSAFGALANLDGDDQAEVIFSYGYEIIAYQHDGIEIWREALTVSNPGPPCAGDIDGDGEVEIIAPSGTALIAFEADGTQKWSMPMQDGSGAAGCSVFDMNGDEIYEVLFADEIALRVYEGATGTVLYENTTHDSVTYFETPVVADVDNDGSAEMLVVNSGSTAALTVFGHNGSEWPASGPTWGLHDFSATNQDPDGSIPQSPVAPWLEYNICRGRPFDDVPGTPNLAVDIVDVCVSSCYPDVGVVTISVQAHNDGGNDSEETTISLYLVSGGVDTWYASAVLPAIEDGSVLAASTFEVPLSDWTGEFAVVVDDGGSGIGVVSECYEDDNRSAWAGELCP
jgi:hypothetical protein